MIGIVREWTMLGFLAFFSLFVSSCILISPFCSDEGCVVHQHESVEIIQSFVYGTSSYLRQQTRARETYGLSRFISWIIPAFSGPAGF